eukprot:GFUD01054404.1.p1 GENE.GFUD01054404.1~~GFUD01054404.1.p1  ORF type:complete len:519 (-),score=150.78 GFUD01054404.1:91-1647(-)
MKDQLVILVLVLVQHSQGRHEYLQDSKSSELKTLQEDDALLPAGDIEHQTPRIITKYDFMHNRNKKSHLTVTQEKNSPRPQRRGRSNAVFKGRLSRTNLKDISQAVSSAPMIEGVRMEDDASDKVVHRNGRFINNVFVAKGENVPIPAEYTVTALVGETPKPSKRSSWQVKPLQRTGRSRFSDDYNENEAFQARRLPFKFKFKDFYSGRKQDMRDAMAVESRQEEVYAMPDEWSGHQAEERASSEPVYFIAEDPDSLHADRSPYTFEPADSHASQHQQSAVISASNEDFVIKEHTYQMCPGCPTFSIPIPVPKASASSNEVINPFNIDPGYEYQHEKEETIMERIMAAIQPAIDTARDTVKGLFNPDTVTNEISQGGFTDRLSTIEGGEKSDVSPLMYAGMAAMGLGVATLISSGLQIMSVGGGVSGRQFDTMGTLESVNSVDNEVLEYNMSDILCMPRNYCEKLKRNKYLIDQYPTVKMAASLLAGLVFDTDSVQAKGESSVYNQCNLRECVFTLLQ